MTFSIIFPLFIVPATIIGLIYRHLAIGYLSTGRDLRRMESNSRSPIFANFGEVLEGIVTVRAFSAERRFLDDLHTKIDTATKVSRRRMLAHPVFRLTRYFITDVVQLLDDQPVAPPSFRRPWSIRSSGDYSLRFVRLRQCRTCGSMHHVRYVIHHECILGLPLLDRP